MADVSQTLSDVILTYKVSFLFINTGAVGTFQFCA